MSVDAQYEDKAVCVEINSINLFKSYFHDNSMDIRKFFQAQEPLT